MAAPQNAGLPDSLDLGGGYIIEFTALDASSGADVTAVKVSLATLTIGNVSASVGGEITPPTPVAPLWVPLPLAPAGVGTSGGSAPLVTLNAAVQADAVLDTETKQWADALTAALAA